VIQRRAWAVVGGSFVIAYAVLVSSVAMKADRYLLPLLPAGIVFACALAAEVAARWARPAAKPGAERKGAPRPDPAVAAALRRREGWRMAGLVAVLALPLAPAFAAHLASLGPDARTSAAAWLEAQLPVGSFIACESYGPALTSPLEIQAIDRDLLPELQRRGYQPRLYAVQTIPMFQVAPERSAAFYDPALYRVADAFVVTGAVRDRYRQEPARFAAQLALYDTLEQHWIRWRVFAANGGPGSEIVVYRNPAQPRTFAARRPDPGPVPELRVPSVSGGEAYFLCNLGLNYQVFGFLQQALAVYERGLGFAATEPGPAAACAERAALVLARLGRKQDALHLLAQAASQAPRPLEAARMRAMSDRLIHGGP
jgi:tetratricopeptide (TPR) repeat protein